MVRRRIAEAVEAMDATLVSGDAERMWSGAALDSRRVAGGELFFALPGERTDGHSFVAAALAAGAAAAVVGRPVEAPADATLLVVADPYAALHALTRAVRREVPGRVVAITGSVGKSTTKELLAAMLGRRFRVARNPGNLNNLYGFPVALLGIPDDTEWMVAEMGMSSPGELAEVSRLGRPDVVVLTTVRPAHLEFFGSLEAIAEAKAEIFAGLAPDGLVVANADDPQVARITRRRGGRIVWYGRGEEVEVRAAAVAPLGSEAAGGHRFLLTAGGEEQEVLLPLHGDYNVDNCLGAAAAAWALGVPLAEIAAAVAVIRPLAMRGVVHRLSHGTRVIDDSYNSNPDALSRAMAAAAALPGLRRWAVVGDMLELGDAAGRFHREAGKEAVAAGFSPLLVVGELAREMAAGAAQAGGDARWFADAASAAKAAARELRDGDIVLVKGSRGVGLEVVVEALRTVGGGDA